MVDYSSDYTRVVCAMMQYGDEILLKRRTKPPFKGMLCMPGGKVKKKETPRTALYREILEETGLTPKGTYLAGEFVEIVSEEDTTYRNLILAYFVEPENFNYLPSTEEGENVALRYYDLTNPENAMRKEVAPWDLRFIDGADTRRANALNRQFCVQKVGGKYRVLGESQAGFKRFAHT